MNHCLYAPNWIWTVVVAKVCLISFLLNRSGFMSLKTNFTKNAEQDELAAGLTNSFIYVLNINYNGEFKIRMLDVFEWGANYNKTQLNDGFS